MSDSELSDAESNPVPPDADLEESLRQAVVKAKTTGTEATVNTIRTISEQELGLGSGFYNDHEIWKARSKSIIKEQFELQDAQAEDIKDEEDIKHAAKKNTSKAAVAPSKAQKRGSTAGNTQPKKRAKPRKAEDDSDVIESSLSESDEKVVEPKSKQLADSKTKNNVELADDSESELSEVIDEEPPKRRRSKSKDTVSTKTSKPRTSKAKTEAEADPDQEEIKRLQGWLVKCGIRKVWGKELKPYETSKAKIKHLKGMLADAGMIGRYSNEKASQIKESRELAADIEAVQEGNERWGKSEDEDGKDDETAGSRGARRLVRGAKHYDFLSSDGEETD